MPKDHDKGGIPNTPIARANRARNMALRQLIEENKERYALILGEQRQSMGLNANPEIDKKKKQVERHVNSLKKLGVTVNLDEMLAALNS